MSHENAPAGHRIGYVVKRYPRFSETFVVSEILAREALGADLDIFSLRPGVDSRFHDSLSLVRAGVTYLHRITRPAELWHRLGGALPDLPGLPLVLPELLATDAESAGQAVELAQHVRERGIRHLHAHFASSATTVARLASLLADVPYSFTAHAKDIFADSVDHGDLETKLADAHHVVTVSDFNADYLARRHGRAAAKVHRVYNGVDLDTFGYHSDAADRGPIIVAVGRLVEKKGFDVLLTACASLAGTGRAFRCRIVGGGALETELRAQVAALGLDDRVELTGPLSASDVRDTVRSAAVLAAPCVAGSDGNTDGLPTVLLEAMALGTPCVSTDIVGIGEAVRHDRTGLLVPPHDPASLALALSRLLDEPQLRARLADSARTLVEHEFDGRRQAAELNTLLHRDTTVRVA